jgi:hypothetical protein
VDLLPARIPDPDRLALLADILATAPSGVATGELRLRLLARDMSWQALVDLAGAQGVILPLIWSLSQRSLLLPLPRASHAPESHPTRQLQSLYRRHLQRRAAQQEQLTEIVAALNNAGVEPLLLKGARYLLAPVGSWCEARDMRDIDLLVRPAEAGRAAAALNARGYAFESGSPPLDQHLPELFHPKRPSAVELHTEGLSFSARGMLATDEIWRRGLRADWQALRLLMLPPEWQLLHALLNHQVSDRGHVRRLLAVRPLWELTMLSGELSDQAWRTLADHADASGAGDILASWLVQAQLLFGFPCPAAIEPSPLARRHAQETMTHAGAPDWWRRARFLADQLRFGLGRQTMAVRYGVAPEEVSLRLLGRHLRFLLARHRGRIRQRLLGERDRRA